MAEVGAVAIDEDAALVVRAQAEGAGIAMLKHHRQHAVRMA